MEATQEGKSLWQGKQVAGGFFAFKGVDRTLHRDQGNSREGLRFLN